MHKSPVIKILLLSLTFCLYFSNAAAQIDTSFLKIFKDLGKPPQNCPEAFDLLNKKTAVEGKSDSVNYLDKKEIDLKQLKAEIERHIENFKSNMDSFNRPAPQTQQPDFPGFPEDIRNPAKDIRKCERASVKIDSLVSKYKGEIVVYLDSLNASLKRTLVSDSLSRETIANNFLSEIYKLYDKYYFQIEAQVKIIDNFVFNYDLKEKIYYPFESFKLMQCQFSEIKAALFLLNIIKESSKIGDKFHISKDF